MGIFQKIFGSRNQRELRKLQPIVDRINGLEPTFKAKSDDELKAMTPEFKRRLEKGATLDEILPEAFAVVSRSPLLTVAYVGDSASQRVIGRPVSAEYQAAAILA